MHRFWLAERTGALGANSLLLASGRARLSHYLEQHVLCVLVFYGFGLGLFGRSSYSGALLVACAVYLVLALRPAGTDGSAVGRLSYGHVARHTPLK